MEDLCAACRPSCSSLLNSMVAPFTQLALAQTPSAAHARQVSLRWKAQAHAQSQLPAIHCFRGCARGRSSGGQVLALGTQDFPVVDEEEDDDEDEGEEDPGSLDYEEEAKRAVTEYNQSLREEIYLEEEDEPQTGGRKRRKRAPRFSFPDENQVPNHLLPKVAVVGRPNVGKSALFNRIAGGDIAIVHDEPGVTRDRKYSRAYWGELEFMLVDTGGVMTISNMDGFDVDGIAVTSGGGPEALDRAMREAAVAGLPALIEKQAAAAVEDCCSVIFVVDGQAGVTGADIDIANWLRKKHSNKTITLAVNKCESPTKGQLQALEFWCLGFTPIAVSAISGTGTGDLLDAVCANLKKPELSDDQRDTVDRPLALSIVGKPNVGKSSILNALVGEERTIVSPISGTTRDSIDTDFIGPNGQAIRLIDTAGIRRRSAVAAAGSATEKMSVNRAFRAIRLSDVVALVIDAMACVTEQDYRLGERIEKEGKACVIVVNKWDTIPDKNSKTTLYYDQDVKERLRVLDWAPIVYSSATSGQRVQRILVAAIEAEKQRSRRLSTSILNQVIHEAVALRQPPTTRGGRKGKIYFCTQAAIRPPTFVFFVNDAKLFPEIYRRYMEKQIRQNVGYPGTPVRLLWRSKQKREREKPPQRGKAASGVAVATP